MLLPFFLAIGIAATNAGAAALIDEQLVGRWCSNEITVHLANGTVISSKSNASEHTVQTFSKDRVTVEWARLPQSARWTQSYLIVALGQLSMKMLEHSSLPALVGSRSAYRYQRQGDRLLLISQPQEKQEPTVESTWNRCE